MMGVRSGLAAALLSIMLGAGETVLAQNADNQALESLSQLSMDELMNVKITTAGKRPERLADIPASVTVVTRTDIDNYGYRSLNEILSNIPGFYTVDGHGYPGVVNGVRGYWSGFPRNIIILVNGQEQTNSYGVYHRQNVDMPVEAIDRIEIIRGPMSIMYGSGAFLGAVNIITNRNFDERSRSVASLSYGSENTRRAALRYSKNTGDGNYVFNGGYFNTAGPDEPLSRVASDMASLEELYGISEVNGNTTTRGRLKHKNFYFNLSGQYRGFWADMSLNQSERDEYHFWPSVSDGLMNRMNFTAVSFGYEKKVSERFTAKAVYHYWLSSYWREFDYFFEDFYGQEIDNSRAQRFELNGIYSNHSTFEMIAGVNYGTFERNFKLDLRDVYLLSTGQYLDGVKSLAMFSQAHLTLSRRLEFIAGLRFEKQFKYDFQYFNNEIDLVEDFEYELGDFELLPRLALVFNISRDHALKLLYGRAVKLPTVFDVTNQLVGGGEDLKSEFITTYEINYLATLAGRYTINASLFQNNLDHLLTARLQFDDEGNWAPEMTNSGKMQTRGLEVILQGQPCDRFNFEFSTTVQKTRNLESGLKDVAVGYSPHLLGHVKLAWHMKPRVIAALTGRYVDEMQTRWDGTRAQADGSFGGRLGQTVEDYLTLDCSLRINDFLVDQGFLSLRCTNILDTDYLFPVFTSNQGWADKGMWGYGRRIQLTIGRGF